MHCAHSVRSYERFHSLFLILLCVCCLLCQMNYAHLEKCLYETREEAKINLCASEQRASEYTALRGSTVKLLALFERLRSCVNNPVGMADFVDSLRALAQSVAK